MALRTPPSWLQNGSHPAENDRLSTQAIWKTSGVVNSGDLTLTQNSTPNMTVNVATGWAAIVGTTQSNMGVYMAYNDATANLTVTTANPSLPRIDLVCITVNDAFYVGSTNNVVFQVIAGTPNASPTVPATPANSLALAQIAVAAAASSIVTANITNYGTIATSPFGNVTTTGTQTLTNKTLTAPIVNTPTIIQPTITAPFEVGQQLGAFGGATNIDVLTGEVVFYTATSTANGTLNFRGNSTTTLNSVTLVGAPVSVILIINNTTAYYPTAFTIDGTAVTPKWVGGTAPTAGNANAFDMYSFTIWKTAATPAYVVFAGGPTKFA